MAVIKDAVIHARWTYGFSIGKLLVSVSWIKQIKKHDKKGGAE